VGKVDGSGLLHAEVELIVDHVFANSCTVSAGGTVAVDIPGGRFQNHLVVSGGTGNRFDRGHGVRLDPPVILDPFEINFQPAGRGTQLWEILIELGNASAKIGIFLYEDHVVSNLSRFQGGS